MCVDYIRGLAAPVILEKCCAIQTAVWTATQKHLIARAEIAVGNDFFNPVKQHIPNRRTRFSQLYSEP
jgi:hypothetical protein